MNPKLPIGATPMYHSFYERTPLKKWKFKPIKHNRNYRSKIASKRQKLTDRRTNGEKLI